MKKFNISISICCLVFINTFASASPTVVNFTADSIDGCAIPCINFTNLTTIDASDSIITWNWNFGDGSPASVAKSPSHCFSQAGYYDITLTATSSHGYISTLTKSHLVHVFAHPVAEFNPTPNPATLTNPTFTFTNQSSTDVNYWYWNFGDGNTLAPATSSPVHTYPSVNATYMVTLAIHNTDGCYDTVAHGIIVGTGSSGIESISEPYNISAYPNPTTGIINLQIGHVGRTQIKVYNLFAECIYQNIRTSSNFQIDMSTQPKGIYLMQIIDANKNVANRKIVLQ